MALPNLEKKNKVNDIATGISLVVISKIELLANADRTPKLIDGFKALLVEFTEGTKNAKHEQIYIMDGGIRQKYFTTMLNDAGVSLKNGPPKVSQALGKRLYIAIQEVHHVCNEEVVISPFNNEPIIDKYIFRTAMFFEDKKPPYIKGDPSKTGIPSGDFITYKQVAKEEVFVPNKPIEIVKSTAIKNSTTFESEGNPFEENQQEQKTNIENNTEDIGDSVPEF